MNDEEQTDNSSVAQAKPVVSGENGQAGQGAPTTFFNGDVNSLPDNLKETYNSMLRDYRSKTEEVANQRKDIESVKKKAELFDTISSDKAFVDYWNGLSKKEQKETVADALNISDEEWSGAFQSKDAFLGLLRKTAEAHSMQIRSELDESRKKIQAQEARLIIDDFVNETDGDGKQMRPDFDELDRLGMVEYQLLKNPPRDSSEKAYYVALDKAYKTAKEAYGAIYTKGREAGLGRVQEKIDVSSERPTGSVQVSGTKIDFKNLSPREQAEEAVRLAREGKRVAR